MYWFCCWSSSISYDGKRFSKCIGFESREQFLEHENKLPDNAVACVGGGRNAMGIFSGFIDDKEVELYGVEPMGKGDKIGEHSASLTYGEEGIMHGFNSIMLKDKDGNPAPCLLNRSGIDYPSVGPEHAYLKESGRSKVGLYDDNEAVDAFINYLN